MARKFSIFKLRLSLSIVFVLVMVCFVSFQNLISAQNDDKKLDQVSDEVQELMTSMAQRSMNISTQKSTKKLDKKRFHSAFRLMKKEKLKDKLMGYGELRGLFVRRYESSKSNKKFVSILMSNLEKIDFTSDKIELKLTLFLTLAVKTDWFNYYSIVFDNIKSNLNSHEDRKTFLSGINRKLKKSGKIINELTKKKRKMDIKKRSRNKNIPKHKKEEKLKEIKKRDYEKKAIKTLDMVLKNVERLVKQWKKETKSKQEKAEYEEQMKEIQERIDNVKKELNK